MDKNWIKQAEAWLKTQELSIESCDINIRFYREQIANLNQSIAAELAEKKTKIVARDAIAETLKNHK